MPGVTPLDVKSPDLRGSPSPNIYSHRHPPISCSSQRLSTCDKILDGSLEFCVHSSKDQTVTASKLALEKRLDIRDAFSRYCELSSWEETFVQKLQTKSNIEIPSRQPINKKNLLTSARVTEENKDKH